MTGLPRGRLKSGVSETCGAQRPWWVHLGWALGGGILGMAVAAGFAGIFRLSRDVYLVPYALLAGTYLYAYMRWSELALKEFIRHHWLWGVIGGVLVGVFGVWAVLQQPLSPMPNGFDLVFNLVWLGIVYGTVDGLLLSVLPVFAIWRALTGLGWTKRVSGCVIAGLLALVGSMVVVAVYHLGYPEFRGPQVIFPVVGVSLMSLIYVLTGNPLSAVISHVAMHMAAVLYGLESVSQLPPHY